MLCVVAFLLLACVVLPAAALAILAATGRKSSDRDGLSLPPSNGVR